MTHIWVVAAAAITGALAQSSSSASTSAGVSIPVVPATVSGASSACVAQLNAVAGVYKTCGVTTGNVQSASQCICQANNLQQIQALVTACGTSGQAAASDVSQLTTLCATGSKSGSKEVAAWSFGAVVAGVALLL
ncbi:UNVERIFIED_CONTAM: hypothetical protein HDU68_003363 [Siphonaria sp. JEL0065]|nr:hypothetical protein HDU68_003363 [Siphonaria sp. JEL0065]